MSSRSARIVGSVVTLALILAAVGGCAGSGAVPDPAPVASEETTPAVMALTEDELAAWGMVVTDKQTRFEPGFPWQAPVIDGDITLAEVDGAGTHFYRIELERPAARVAEWYLRSYPNANWIIHDARTTSENGVETTVIEVTKGAGAWSRVLVEGDGTSAVVEASVGVGTPPEGVF